MKHHSKNRVRMYDTDAAGILYFAQQFRFSHDAWEMILADAGFGVEYLFGEADWTMVMVHCEADYMKHLRIGDAIDVYSYLMKVGNSSFRMGYDIERQGELVGRCETVQVILDRKSGRPKSVPDELLHALERYRKE